MAKRLLIADDDHNHLKVISEFLIKQGYEVVLATDGLAALRLVRSIPFELVILDIKMPVMTGLEVLEAMITEYYTIPILLCTAFPKMVSDPSARNPMVKGSIFKPVSLEQLLFSVNKILHTDDLKLVETVLINKISGLDREDKIHSNTVKSEIPITQSSHELRKQLYTLLEISPEQTQKIAEIIISMASALTAHTIRFTPARIGSEIEVIFRTGSKEEVVEIQPNIGNNIRKFFKNLTGIPDFGQPSHHSGKGLFFYDGRLVRFKIRFKPVDKGESMDFRFL